MENLNLVILISFSLTVFKCVFNLGSEFGWVWADGWLTPVALFNPTVVLMDKSCIADLCNPCRLSPRQDGKPGKLSAQTIKHHYRCISAILQDAVEWQIISYNPAARVKPPSVKKRQIDCYDEKQTADLLQALVYAPLKYRVLILLVITSGAREGEIMGLEWKHVDYEKNTIRIEQASQYLSGKGIFTKEPKNEGSKRLVAIPSSVMALLKQYQKEQAELRLELGSMWQGSDRLFTTADGKPAYPG